MTQVIVFDMDDTLFPERDFVKSGFLAVDSFLQSELSINNFFEKAWKDFNSGNRDYIFNIILENIYSGKKKEKLVNKLVRVYRSHLPNIKLYSDAEWALKHFSKYAPLALLSDGYLETQKNKAKMLDIKPYIEKFYFTDQWGKQCWKPSDCAFKKVEQDFKLTCESYTYIADNPIKDFIAPKIMGWKTICINRGFGEYDDVKIPLNGEPDYTIKNLYELEEIIEL